MSAEAKALPGQAVCNDPEGLGAHAMEPGQFRARTPAQDLPCPGSLAQTPHFRLNGGWPPPGRRRILSCVLARVRKWFDGAGWFVGAAVVLLVFALLAALAGLQSTDSMLWTGQQVTGTEQQGLVYYRWQGQSYSLDVPGFGSSKAVSVYFNPGDPSQAIVDNVLDRVLAGLLILGPAAGAVALLVIGGTRNYRWQRRKLKRAREFRL
jgi:hypothetical protein